MADGQFNLNDKATLPVDPRPTIADSSCPAPVDSEMTERTSR